MQASAADVSSDGITVRQKSRAKPQTNDSRPRACLHPETRWWAVCPAAEQSGKRCHRAANERDDVAPFHGNPPRDGAKPYHVVGPIRLPCRATNLVVEWQ